MGVNVPAREVEIALMGFDDVSLAAVVGIPDPERERIVAAAILPEEGQTLVAQEVAERLRARISSFLVPRRIWICQPGEMPMTASGTIAL